MNIVSDIKKLTKKIIKFRQERDWHKHDNPKSYAISLVLEAAEVLEHFQWEEGKDLDEYIKSHREEIGFELGDVLYWVLLMCHEFDIDIAKSFEKKMEKNKKKFPEKLFRKKTKKERMRNYYRIKKT